jgi:ribosome-associated translation inhibitor RaiA
MPVEVEVEVEVGVEPGVASRHRAVVRRRLEALARFTDHPLDVRATLRRRRGGRGRHPYVLDARIVYGRRVLAAHVAGPAVDATAVAAVDRLRRQLRRVVDGDVALRNEPRILQRALVDLALELLPPQQTKPAEERVIVRRHAYSARPESTYEAISDLLDDDAWFRLFVHARTAEDVVVHRLGHSMIGLLHPRGSLRADETDAVVVSEPSPHSEPLTLADARAELDLARQRFVYFVDAQDARGKVLYVRRDQDYGLVEPR